MTPDELEEIPAAIERLFYDQQARVMEDVVRRIHKTGRITSTADYQIGKMAQQGKSTEWIESEIKRLGNLTDAEVRSLYDKVIQADYVRKRGLYEQVNANYTPYEDNKVMQKWVHALIDQTQGELKNISRSMGFSVPTGNGKTAFTPLADYYQRYIDRACMDIMTGAFDYNTVLRRVAKEMADSGLEYVSYASGHVDRATVAARRAVMTGVNQLSGQINMRLADELGTNHFEVSWHSGARPEHWWGGQVFSKEDLVDVCGYGEVTGLLGANCRHSFMPFVPGVSTRTYTDEQLEEMNARERETKTYNGKEYNAYSATQRQRELERRMQKQRANIVNLKKGEGSKEDIAAAQAKYLKTLYQYRDFSKQMGLSPQMERVYVDRLGRVMNNGRPKSTFSENSGAKGDSGRSFRHPIDAGVFKTFTMPRDDHKQVDVIKPKNIIKELHKSDVGKAAYEYITKHNIPVGLLYNVNNDDDVDGYYDRIDKTINIYIDKTRTVHETAKTFVHEATHCRINSKGNTQKEEVRCFIEEKKFDGEKLTYGAIKTIISNVKKNDAYKDLPWR